MYRMLVVDDEQVVLDSMKYIIDGDFSGKIELYTVRSGREAIEISEELSFDIVFMDLKMPGIGGIEASKEIKANHDDVSIVFITAYEAFSFAKEAIQIGVKEYLLKPIIKDKVVILLNKMIRNIEKKRGKRKEQLLLLEKFQNILPVLENSFINALLLSGAGSDDFAKYKNLLEIDEDGGYIITVELDDANSMAAWTKSVDLGFKNDCIFKPVFEMVKTRYHCLVSGITVNRAVFFIPCSDFENEYKQRISAISMGEYIRKQIFEQTDIDALIIGIGCCFQGMENIVQSFEQSLLAIRHSSGSDLLHIMDVEQIHKINRNYPMKTERQLFNNISLAQVDDAIKNFDLVFNWLVEEYGKDSETFKMKIYELDVLLNRLLWDYADRDEDFPIHSDDTRYIDQISSVTEIRAWFIRRIKAVISFIRKEKSDHESIVIKKVKTYLKNNFMNELSQSKVAEEVTISPHYLSKLFKDETGISFVEYLTDVRLENAKDLLKSGHFSVKEICFRVGYTDPNYFSRLFKKVVGVSPTQYKDEEMSWEPDNGVYIIPGEDSSTGRADGKILIGLSMASMYEERWKKDKRAFLKRAKELGCEVLVKIADNNHEKQIQQVQTLLHKGIDVLVIIPQNSEKMGRIIADVKTENIKVISYCRLIMNADIDMYIAFDGIRIGELMAETVVNEVPQGNYVIVNGSKSDYNSRMYNQGIRNVLEDHVQKGSIHVVAEIWADDWQPQVVKREVERVITRDPGVHAIICGNDTLAEAAIQVLDAYGLAGSIKVTGHDADFSGLKHTLDGTQLMTVYTSFESLAALAADYAFNIARGQEVKTHWSIFNGLKDVPFLKKQPVAVTLDNIKEIIQVSGYYDHEEKAKGFY